MILVERGGSFEVTNLQSDKVQSGGDYGLLLECQDIDMKQGVRRNALSEVVGYQLKQVNALLRVRMDEALRPMGLTVPQYACLDLLGRQSGLSNAELARGAFVTRQSMKLVLRGLVQRASAGRGRARPSQLSDEGCELLELASTSIAAVERQMLAGIPAHQQDDLRAALNQCAANLA